MNFEIPHPVHGTWIVTWTDQLIHVLSLTKG